ncbi:MAG: hypothetical protein QG675_289 [Patescibacteria group bacterium]|jgi:succinate dehydrogenase/fumarate reductase cytochrome b subunit|nr:hypothetical protein [Patescibacteria group bacterium]
MAKTKTTIKPNRAGSRVYFVTGLSLVSIYFVLMILLRLFQSLTNTSGSDTATTAELHPIVIYLSAIFYFLIPISYFLGIPIGVILVIIGIVKRNKKSW